MKSPVPLLAGLLGAAIVAHGQTPADERSPFLPANVPGDGMAGQGPQDGYELAGASPTSDGVQICLFNTSTKHSRWLTVGKSDDGIQVVSYDPTSDQAVVRFDGQTHVLELRKVKTGSGGIAFTSAPVMAPAPPGSSAAANAPVVDPSTVGKSAETVKQEREARMLVSDLLEISIAQRKAYEEAQKKAAAQAAQKAKPPGS